MEFKIGPKLIGENCPVFFIAEAGVNHNGSISNAKKLVDIAFSAKADAIKFQTFKAKNLNIPESPKSTYHIETTGDDSVVSWYDLLKNQELSLDSHKQIISYCKSKKIIFLSTPYDEESADLLESLNVPAFKIASTDTNNIPFLKYLAKKKKPIFLSTAMSTIEEVTEAVDTIRAEDLKEIVLMQCTGNYPTKLKNSNLNVIKQFKDLFKCLVGYSDHSLDNINPIAATSLGVCAYEKHFTIDKNMSGPDHRMSLSPRELKETVRLIRLTEQALGNYKKKVLKEELENRMKLRKSIVTNTDIKKDEIFTNKNLKVKRPGYGILPKEIDKILGKKSKLNIKKNTLLSKDMFD